MLLWDVGLYVLYARQTAELALYVAFSARSEHPLVGDREDDLFDVWHITPPYEGGVPQREAERKASCPYPPPNAAHLKVIEQAFYALRGLRGDTGDNDERQERRHHRVVQEQ
jgi:hypothetical protein